MQNLAVEKHIQAITIPRCDTAINWSKAVNFIPAKGEIIIYSIDTAEDIARGYYVDEQGNKITSVNGYIVMPSSDSRLKIGDGTHIVSALPFAASGTQTIAYGTCTTAAATAAKVITTANNAHWELTAGSMITVKFSNTNTAQNPTFNINNTGAKNVYYSSAQITTSSLSYAGYKNRPMTFMYDGAQYIFTGWGADSNSDTKVQQNAVITTDGEYPVILGYDTRTTAVTNYVNKASGLTYNPSTETLTVPNIKGNIADKSLVQIITWEESD